MFWTAKKTTFWQLKLFKSNKVSGAYKSIFSSVLGNKSIVYEVSNHTNHTRCLEKYIFLVS